MPSMPALDWNLVRSFVAVADAGALSKGRPASSDWRIRRSPAISSS